MATALRQHKTILCSNPECRKPLPFHRRSGNTHFAGTRAYCNKACYCRWSPGMQDLAPRLKVETPTEFADSLSALHKEHGTFRAVARHLDVSHKVLIGWEKNLGIYSQHSKTVIWFDPRTGLRHRRSEKVGRRPPKKKK